MKFKNYIEVQSGIKDSANSSGTPDQVLTSTATGVAWVDPSTISAEAATLVVIECKNTSGATITKGTPVYQTGTVGATDVIEIAVADASDEDKMAAIGLLQTTLNNNGFGKVVITGELLNITTSPIDGVTPIAGDTIYVKPGGGLTLTKPTGVNFIQNVGLVGKVSGGNAGSITVSSIMRTNDVPNLTTGKIWVGTATNTAESATVYLDEPNGRMGIGTTSPGQKLEVSFAASVYGARFTRNDAAGSSLIEFANNTGVKSIVGYDAGVDGYRIGTSTANNLTVKQSGNVGIGTASPSQKLDVDGSVNIDGTLFVNTNNNHIRLIDTDNTGNFSVGVNTNFQIRDITANTTPLTIRAGTPSDTILTTASGRVGIGLSSPSTTLHVGGFTRINGGLQMNTANATIYQILDSALRFGTNNTERMRIDSTGNVGIGTTSPAHKLTVNAANDTTAVGIDFPSAHFDFSANSTSGYNASFHMDNVGMDIGHDSAARSLNLITGNLDRVTILGNGNVGIGTTNPVYKLDVVGTGSFTGQVTIPATPVASTDAASKSYVDNSVAAIITPAAPSTVTSTIVGETIEIEFNESATSDIDYYQVWSSDDGGDYGIIGQITSDDFSSTMTVVDTTFVTGGTMSYRIYAVRQGVYSAAATTSKSYTVSALSVTNMTVVNLNTAYYIQYEKPNSRFIDHIEIYMDSQTTLATLNRSNATLVYSGQNASYMRSVGTSSNFHQFWVEVVTS